MSTERIDVELVDKIAPSVSANLQSIATNADKSAGSLERLQAQLNTINGSGLLRLQAQMSELASANVTLAATFAGFNQVLTPTLASITKLEAGYMQLSQATVHAAQGQLALAGAMRQSAGGNLAMPTGSPASVRAINTALSNLSGTYAGITQASAALTQAWATLDASAAALTIQSNALAAALQRVAVVSALAAQAAQATGGGAAGIGLLGREMTALQVTLQGTNAQLGQLAQSLNTCGNAANNAARGGITFTTMLTGMMALQVIKWMTDLIDTYVSLSNRLAVAQGENGNLEKSMQGIFKIANATRTPVEELAKVYQQTGLAAKDLGATQKDSVKFVQAVAQSIAIQGSTATSARGALIQLSQALGTGKIRAEEFNSMLEGSYTIVKYAAQGIERMGGSVGKLRQEVVNGKVSSAEFFNAILSQAAAIDAQFQKTAVTIDQALTVMHNKLVEFVGESKIAADVSSVFGTAILVLADNLSVLGPILVAAGIAALPVILTAASAAVSGLIAAIAPFAGIGSVIAGAVGLLYAFSDQIKLSENGLTSLHDAFVAAFGGIIYYINLSITGWKNLLSHLEGRIPNPFASFTTFLVALGLKLKDDKQEIKDTLELLKDASKAKYPDLKPPKTMGEAELAKVVDLTSKFNTELENETRLLKLVGAARVVQQEMDKFDAKLKKDGLSISKAQREEMTQALLQREQLKALSGSLDKVYSDSQAKHAKDYKNDIDAVNLAFTRNIVTSDEADQAIRKLTFAYNEFKLSADDKVLKKYNDELIKQATLAGKVGEAAVAAKALYEAEKLAAAGGAILTDAQKRQIETTAVMIDHAQKLDAALQNIYNETQKKKAEDYKTQQDAIRTALAAQVISASEAEEAINKLNFAYEKITLTPVGKIISDMNDQLDRQKALLGKVGPELAKATALYDAQQKAKAAGTVVTPDEAQRITDLAAATQMAVLAQDQFNEAFSKAKDPIERYNEKVNKASLLLHDGIINQEGYTRAVRAFAKERDSSIDNKEAFAIEHVTKKLDDQIQSTKLLGDEKERQQKFDQINESLHSKHIQLTAEQTEKIKEQIAAIVEQTHVQQIMESLYKSTEGAVKDYERTQTAVNLLLQKSPQYVGAYSKALNDARMKVLELNNTAVAGLEHGLLAELKKVGNVTGTVSTFVTGAFDALENSFIKLLKTGKMDWTEFATTVIEMAMKMVTELLILKPIIEAIKASISGGVGGGIGGSIAGLMGFANGGEFEVGGSTATDSNVVAFRATAGERVSVMTPDQARNSRSSISVNVENYGTAKEFEVQQIDENTVRIIARDEAARAVQKHTVPLVSAAIRDPNSVVSKTLQSQTTSQRRRG